MTLCIPKEVFNLHTVVLGKTRAGKSTTMRGFAEWLLDHDRPLCILDPKGDWWGLKSSADGKRPGYPIIIFGGLHADVPIDEHSGADLGELIATGNRPCIIDLSQFLVGERTRFFRHFAESLFRHTRGRRVLMIDEAHNFAPQGKVFDIDAGKMLHWANKLAAEGGGKGISLISASQRPQKVHKDYLTCHETLIAMRVIHPLDRNAMKEWIDGCPDATKGKEVLGSLAGMARGEGWVWSPEIGFGPKLIKFPMFRTFDSFKPAEEGHDARLEGWASVDLAEITGRLATVAAEAKANDPKALKARIAELERQTARAPPSSPPPASRPRGSRSWRRRTSPCATSAYPLLNRTKPSAPRTRGCGRRWHRLRRQRAKSTTQTSMATDWLR